ncbi:MAG: NUDIX hydrolase [Candidatus Limnocylindrales bacterium]
MTAPSEPGSKRQSVAAIALIRREEAAQTLYLTQWNLNWRALNLVGGHKRPNESFRDCLVREFAEELGLRAGDNYHLPDRPVRRLELEAFSEGAWGLTAYEIELFDVELRGDAALAKVAANPDNRWVTESEILSGWCNDGTRVSPTIMRIVMMLFERTCLTSEGSARRLRCRHGTPPTTHPVRLPLSGGVSVFVDL